MELPLVLRDAFPWCATWEKQLRELFACYVESKQSQNVLDYDDLLLYWAQMVAEPMIAEDIGSRFDHVSGEDDAELIATKTRDDALIAQQRDEAARRLLQYDVAGRVAEDVIDRFEAIEIDDADDRR